MILDFEDLRFLILTVCIVLIILIRTFGIIGINSYIFGLLFIISLFIPIIFFKLKIMDKPRIIMYDIFLGITFSIFIYQFFFKIQRA